MFKYVLGVNWGTLNQASKRRAVSAKIDTEVGGRLASTISQTHLFFKKENGGGGS